MSEAIVFNPIFLKTNQGHGNARRASLKNCRNNLVALMDADDISVPHRFQIQLDRFMRDQDLSIVGGQISEFIGDVSNVIGIRKVPEKHKEIIEFSKKRCPMNQMSVMVKKNAVECAGGYIDWYCNEDYYLWIRMIESGFKFENVSNVLVNVRAGEEMSSRRGGWKYFKSEAKLQTYMLRKGFIFLPRYIYNVGARFGGEVILSNKMRAGLFKLMREKNLVASAHLEEDFLNDDNKIDMLSKYPPFSVAICVYGKDNPEWFDTALASVINQTVKPSEIVLVVDGSIPDGIQGVIDKYAEICEGDY